MNATLPTEFLERLRKIANAEGWSDKMGEDPGCIIDDFAGGNVDDAYYGGTRDGEILLARDILALLDQ